MTDVTPITPSHVCASCKAMISTLDVYAGHFDTCMQPEVRMRRLERHVAELTLSVEGYLKRIDELMHEHWGVNL